MWLLQQQIRLWSLAVLAIGITIAEALSPAVEWLSGRLPRALAVILVYVVLLIVLAGICLLIVPNLVNQARSASARIPDLIGKLQSWLVGLNLQFNVNSLNTLLSYVSALGSSIVNVPKAVISYFFDILISFLSRSTG